MAEVIEEGAPPAAEELLRLLLACRNQPIENFASSIADDVEPQAKRRKNTEQSLDTLSDLAIRLAGESSSDALSAEEEDHEYDAEDAFEQDQEEDVVEQPARTRLSSRAAEFFQSRRSALAQAQEHSEALVLGEEGLHAVLPAEQASLCNTQGRVGIYTPLERAYIIERYMAKRERRHWEKKVRYGCRKNLADRRIRVKGRFVKAELAAEIAISATAPTAEDGVWVPAAAVNEEAKKRAVETLQQAAVRGAAGAAGRAMSVDDCAAYLSSGPGTPTLTACLGGVSLGPAPLSLGSPFGSPGGTGSGSGSRPGSGRSSATTSKRGGSPHDSSAAARVRFLSESGPNGSNMSVLSAMSGGSSSTVAYPAAWLSPAHAAAAAASAGGGIGLLAGGGHRAAAPTARVSGRKRTLSDISMAS